MSARLPAACLAARVLTTLSPTLLSRFTTAAISRDRWTGSPSGRRMLTISALAPRIADQIVAELPAVAAAQPGA